MALKDPGGLAPFSESIVATPPISQGSERFSMTSLNDKQPGTMPCLAELYSNNRSCGAGKQAEITPRTLVELLRMRALSRPEGLAYSFLEDGEVEIENVTFGGLDQRARSIGALLQDLKAEGARVLLLYPPGLDYIAAFFGCLYAGAIAVPIYPPRPNRTLARLQEVVADAGAKIALTSKKTLAGLRSSLPNSVGLDELLWLDTETALPDISRAWRQPELQADSLAFLQYTSGSTSQPKGVMVSHGNLLYNAQMTDRAFENKEDFTYVSWLPLYHDMGLIGTVLQPMYAGVPSILMSPLAFLQKPFRWLNAISRYHATVSGGPNFAYDLCVRKITPEQRASLDLSSWRVAFNGAEPVRTETLVRFTETFKEAGFRSEAFYPCYGLAEATLFVSGGLSTAEPIVRNIDAQSFERGLAPVAAVETESDRKLVGCGRAWLDERIAIVDPESLLECPPDRVGEIWVSGPHIAKGYWKRGEESARTFHAFVADTGEGPFLRTGDLGFLRSGELFIAGRLRDLIIIDGRNHYPQDIEETVELSHPAVRPGCCAAFPIDTDGKERLVIVAELDRSYHNGQRSGASERDQTNSPADPQTGRDAIARIVRRAVSERHDVEAHSICLVKLGSIPKTSSGKLRRSACRTAFLAGELAQ
jgi:acyl-CoA synthetase (AMP-forming)/AMP-acid ligase II